MLVPHTMHASTIGSSSFAAIERSAKTSGHKYWNQWHPDQAPHPTAPAASVKMWWSGVPLQEGGSIETVFQEGVPPGEVGAKRGRIQAEQWLMPSCPF